MPRSQEQRPRFFEGQYLGADDLTAAVAYNRLQHARHALGAHTWGIASGLQLKETPLPGGKVDVYVMPGYAWDGFGRPVVVLAPYKIPAELLRSYVYDQALDNGTPAGRLIEVWLRYDETATQNVRPGFEVCDVADQRSRVQETFRVEVGARLGHLDRHDRIAVAGNVVDAQEAVQTLDPQTPPVAIYDESIPYQNFPAEGERAYWLLPLGMARWLPNSNPNQPGNFVPRNAQDLAKSRSLRRYIGVVAESVQAAEGILRLRDRTKDYSQVQSNDLVWVEGSLRVEGDIRLFGRRLDFRYLDGQDFAVPLHIRRTGDPGPGPRALQISLGPESQPDNSLAVGPLKPDNTLDEKFVVLSGGNVGIGTTTPVSKLEVAGDVALEKAAQGTARALPADATMFWNDGTWLRLNQNLDLTKPIFGVHTPGLFAPGSLNVGGAGGWGDPGPGNVWVTGQVGIGTTTPLTKLHVLGNRIRLENSNKLIDIRADGSSVDLHSESNDLFIRSSGPGGNNNVIINPFPEDGNVGIGTTSPSQKLHVQGNLQVEHDLRVVGQALKWNGFTWTALSDERLKEHINPLKNALSRLLQLHGVSFFWRSSESTPKVTGPQMGLIAQQVEKVFPEWVTTTPDGYKALTLNGFEALTIEALRELKAEIESLTSRLPEMGTQTKETPQ